MFGLELTNSTIFLTFDNWWPWLLNSEAEHASLSMAECLIKIIKLCSNILPSRVHFRDLCFMDENPKLICCSYSLFRASQDSRQRASVMCDPCIQSLGWHRGHSRPLKCVTLIFHGAHSVQALVNSQHCIYKLKSLSQPSMFACFEKFSPWVYQMSWLWYWYENLLVVAFVFLITTHKRTSYWLKPNTDCFHGYKVRLQVLVLS